MSSTPRLRSIRHMTLFIFNFAFNSHTYRRQLLGLSFFSSSRYRLRNLNIHAVIRGKYNDFTLTIIMFQGKIGNLSEYSLLFDRRRGTTQMH